MNWSSAHPDPSVEDVVTVTQGFLASIGLIVAIGAQNAFVLRQGVRREHVLVVVALCAASDALLIGAGVAGLGRLVTSHPAGMTIAKIGGATFLLGFAVAAALRALRPERLLPADAAPAGRAGVVLACLGFTFLNPHVYLDTVVLLGSMANQHGDSDRWAFAAGAVAASITWFTALGFGAHRLRPFFARPSSWRWLDAGIAVLMVGLAVTLVV
jgi:L-lysine exporter family protein LysE/ArgO